MNNELYKYIADKLGEFMSHLELDDKSNKLENKQQNTQKNFNKNYNNVNKNYHNYNNRDNTNPNEIKKMNSQNLPNPGRTYNQSFTNNNQYNDLHYNDQQKYFEDDFSGNKRLNRIFTAQQKEECWNKVRLF